MVPGEVRTAVVGGTIPVNGLPGGMSVIGRAGINVVSGLGMMSISGNGGMGGRIHMMNPMMNNNPFCGVGGGTMMPQVQKGHNEM